jgi:hypothetical protein
VPLIIEYDGTEPPSSRRCASSRSAAARARCRSSIATLGFEEGPRSIFRHNQATALRAKVDNPADAREVYKSGLRALGGLDLPRGYSVARGLARSARRRWPR